MAACTPSIHVLLGRPLFLLSRGIHSNNNNKDDDNDDDDDDDDNNNNTNLLHLLHLL